MIDRIVVVVGLPRSGTTLITSLLGARQGHLACYEPWNQNATSAPSPELSPNELCEHFGLVVDDQTHTLIVKETTVDFEGIQWVKRFMEANQARCRVDLLWIVRCYRHGYISFIEAGREQWGNSDMVLGHRSYFRWVSRSLRATRLLQELAEQTDTTTFSYERLVFDTESTLREICKALELSYDPEMLDFAASLDKEQVRGDVGLATEPKPVFAKSVQKREHQWLHARGDLALSGAEKVREELDAFWERINASACFDPVDARKIITPHNGERIQLLADGICKLDVRREFDSIESWFEFIRSNKQLTAEKSRAECVRMLETQGFQHQNRWARPSETRRGQGNVREGFVFDGMNSRQRAVVFEFEQFLQESEINPNDASIYLPEYVSNLANYFRERYPGYVGSEYYDEDKADEKLKRIPREDLTQLSFRQDSYDCVIVNEVFEHLPDIGAALKEIRRVLKPGGTLLSTFPFLFKREEGLQRASLNADGNIDYHTEPEYHGDPVNKQGVLVFRIPGWDIIEQTKAAGYARVNMVFLCKPSSGVIADGISGIFVLKASKPAP
ncbi:MAG: methyltransferase domain-containing protein [Pseudomonadota bacterium]